MGDNRLFDLAFVLSDCNGDVVAAQRRIDSLLGYCNSALNRAVKERDTLRAQLTRLESANAVLREHLTWIRDTEGAAKWQLLAWAGNALAKAGQGEEK